MASNSPPNRYFLVGDTHLLLGTEASNFITFTIHKNLEDIEGKVLLQKNKNNISITIDSILDNKMQNNILSLVKEFIYHNFKNVSILLKNLNQSEEYHKIENTSNSTDKSKFKELIEVYKNPLKVPWNYEPIEIDKILHMVSPISINVKIIEIGAGYGKNIWALKKQGYNAKGIEYSQIAADKANNIFLEKVIDVGSVTNLPYDTSTYNVAVDIGCIHSINSNDQTKAISEVHRILTPGGVLITRIFKNKSKEWREKMPFECDKFGMSLQQIDKLLSNKFCYTVKENHEDYYLLEAIKHE